MAGELWANPVRWLSQFTDKQREPCNALEPDNESSHWHGDSVKKKKKKAHGRPIRTVTDPVTSSQLRRMRRFYQWLEFNDKKKWEMITATGVVY